MNGCSGAPYCNASDANRVVYTNALLSAGANQNWNLNGTAAQYHTGPVNYVGSVTTGFKIDSGINVGFEGYQWLLAKYGGPGGGYVLFNIRDWGLNYIPTSAGALNTRPNQDVVYWVDRGAGLSGWTAYNYIPDGGSVSMLLGAALMGLAGLRRFMK
jgi:hypothetical protein